MSDDAPNAAAVALHESRNVAIVQCRNLRVPQEAARRKVAEAEHALHVAKVESIAATGHVSRKLEEISQLEAAFKQLTGHNMPRPANDRY